MSEPAMIGRMHKVCMYCGDRYGQQPCMPAMDGKDSHGICHARECRQRAADEHGLTPAEAQKFFANVDRETAAGNGGEKGAGA